MSKKGSLKNSCSQRIDTVTLELSVKCSRNEPAIKLGAGCCDSGFVIFLQCKLSYDNHGNAGNPEYHFAVIGS